MAGICTRDLSTRVGMTAAIGGVYLMCAGEYLTRFGSTKVDFLLLDRSDGWSSRA